MKKLEITIKDVSYPIEYGYGAVKYLGIYLREDTYDGTLARVGELAQGLASQESTGKQLKFDVLDTLGYMVMAGVDYAHKGKQDHGLELDEIVDEVMKDTNLFVPIFEGFMNAMPKAKATGKQQAPKKARATKKKQA